MEELTLLELDIGGITFGNKNDDEDHLSGPSFIGSDEESETSSAEISTTAGKGGLGRRLGKALAVTVVVSLIARAVVGRVRGNDADSDLESTDEPEVVSVDTAVADEN